MKTPHKLYHAKISLRLLCCIAIAVCMPLDRLEAQFTQDSLPQVKQDTVLEDTVKVKEKKGSIFTGRPGTAMMMSLVIPGSGQIYNKSYLRVPFVWGAVGGMGYLVYKNTQIYKCRSEAYEAAIDGVPFENCDDWKANEGLEDITDQSTLRILRDEANEARQLSIVGFVLVWLANGVDAYVDAHLKEFDIDDDLSFRFDSKFDQDPYVPMRMGLFVSF